MDTPSIGFETRFWNFSKIQCHPKMKKKYFFEFENIDFWYFLRKGKVGYVFPMVVVYILPHVEFGRNDHREEAPTLIKSEISHWAQVTYFGQKCTRISVFVSVGPFGLF